uniref:Uncharacterized protein n=1 Tax=Pyrodinium bahamense TaxID=73915 RepID=A0A7S0FM62_9DINO
MTAAVAATAAATAMAACLASRGPLGYAQAQPALLARPPCLAGQSASGERFATQRRRLRPAGGRRGVRLGVEPEETPEYEAFTKRHVVDEAALERESDFPIAPPELIKLTKRFLATEAPEATLPGNGSLMADDFRFVGPVIGPLDKEEFMATRDSVDFFRSFPDATAQFHHFRVDPFEPSRVWFTVRGTGQHTGEAVPGSDADVLFGKPTGLRFRNPPQACSCRFTEEGLVNQFTIGYVMDRFIGNTGGLGGFFGVFTVIGKTLPFEEGRPWQPSWGYALYVELGRLYGRLRMLLAKTDEERNTLEKAMIKMPAASDAFTG